jgi:hypothetical protein
MKLLRGLAAGIVAVAMGCVLAAPRLAAADEKPDAKAGIDAKTAFKQLKTLVGSWKSDITETKHADKSKEHPDHPKGDIAVTYKLTGAGSALVETQFPGAAHEMVSVYHLDGNDLRMTHYCAVGNQPRVKLDRAKSTPNHLIFNFDGGTNLDPAKDMHIHALQITFHEDGKVTSAWDGYQDGKKMHTTSFLLTRQHASESGQHSAGSK